MNLSSSFFSNVNCPLHQSILTKEHDRMAIFYHLQSKKDKSMRLYAITSQPFNVNKNNTVYTSQRGV